MRGPIVALSLLLAAAPSCSIVLNTSPDQCANDGDCIAKGAGFEHNVCNAQHTCVFACSQNRDCSDRLGVDAVCHQSDKTCAPLLSQDCMRLHMEPGDLDRDPVILGILLPVTGENAASMVPQENGIELARQQIMSVGGVPAANDLTPTPARPLVFLTCTDADDPIRAARHLAEDVRVPAIIGPAFSGVTTKVAVQVTIPDGVLIMSASATSPTLTNLADNGLVWRTCPSDTFQAVAMSGLITKTVENDVRVTYGIADTDKIRVAVIHKGDAYGSGLADAIYESVHYNKGASASANGTAYFDTDYGDPGKLSAAELKTKIASSVAQVLAFKPHIIIEIGTAEAVTDVFTPIEQNWPSTAGFRPRHVASDGLQIPELVTAIGKNDELRKRVYGTIAGATGGNFDIFHKNYLGIFNDGSTPDSYAAAAYDAAFLMAYAVAGIGGTPLTGKAFDGALHKVALDISAQTNVGSGALNKGYADMRGNGINFNGASGPLDFNTSTGEAPSDIQVWCVDSSGKFANTGLLYSAALKQMTGDIACP